MTFPWHTSRQQCQHQQDPCKSCCVGHRRNTSLQQSCQHSNSQSTKPPPPPNQSMASWKHGKLDSGVYGGICLEMPANGFPAKYVHRDLTGNEHRTMQQDKKQLRVCGDDSKWNCSQSHAQRKLLLQMSTAYGNWITSSFMGRETNASKDKGKANKMFGDDSGWAANHTDRYGITANEHSKLQMITAYCKWISSSFVCWGMTAHSLAGKHTDRDNLTANEHTILQILITSRFVGMELPPQLFVLGGGRVVCGSGSV